MLLATFHPRKVSRDSDSIAKKVYRDENERTYPRNPKSPEKDLRASAAYSVARPPGGRPWFLFGVNYFLCFRLFTPGSK